MPQSNGATPPGLARAIEENEARIAALRQEIEEAREQQEQTARSRLERFDRMTPSERMDLYRTDRQAWREGMDAITERNRTERLGL